MGMSTGGEEITVTPISVSVCGAKSTDVRTNTRTQERQKITTRIPEIPMTDVVLLLLGNGASESR